MLMEPRSPLTCTVSNHLFYLMFPPACCRIYCLCCCSKLLLQMSQSATRKTMTQHKHLHVTFLNYLTLGWEFERQSLTVTLIYFIILQEQDLAPTGHWERDLRKESGKRVKKELFLSGASQWNHFSSPIRDMHIISKPFNKN